jgi:hypothetical protein
MGCCVGKSDLDRRAVAENARIGRDLDKDKNNDSRIGAAQANACGASHALTRCAPQ